jgi:hypothetical protein
MPTQTLAPDPDRLEVLSLHVEQGTIILTARTCSKTAHCPICGRPSSRMHSRSRRWLADLTWQEIPARLTLWSWRFFCDTPACSRHIFTERLPRVAAPHARRTNRLRDWLGHVAFAVGGAPGARLLRQLGITVCGDTLLAHVRTHAPLIQPTPRVLSIDDFAFRRGRTSGSILVDLERHQTVDLLPDRSGSGFAAWLAAHPGVEIISRDRSGAYADGARLGEMLSPLRAIACEEALWDGGGDRIGQFSEEVGGGMGEMELQGRGVRGHSRNCVRCYESRTVFNGLRYLIRTGVPWSWLPHDLPLWIIVY